MGRHGGQRHAAQCRAAVLVPDRLPDDHCQWQHRGADIQHADAGRRVHAGGRQWNDHLVGVGPAGRDGDRCRQWSGHRDADGHRHVRRHDHGHRRRWLSRLGAAERDGGAGRGGPDLRRAGRQYAVRDHGRHDGEPDDAIRWRHEPARRRRASERRSQGDRRHLPHDGRRQRHHCRRRHLHLHAQGQSRRRAHGERFLHLHGRQQYRRRRGDPVGAGHGHSDARRASVVREEQRGGGQWAIAVHVQHAGGGRRRLDGQRHDLRLPGRRHDREPHHGRGLEDRAAAHRAGGGAGRQRPAARRRRRLSGARQHA